MEVVPDPIYTVINSTSIVMHWNETRIPAYNNFNFSSYYIRFWPSDNQSHIYEHTITDQLTTSAVFTNLGVWKTYQAQLWHVGKQYRIISNLLIFRTGQGGKETYVAGVAPEVAGGLQHSRWGILALHWGNSSLLGNFVRQNML